MHAPTNYTENLCLKKRADISVRPYGVAAFILTGGTRKTGCGKIKNLSSANALDRCIF